MTAPGPVVLNDLRDVSNALLFNIMPGQQYAQGLMSVLFGRVSPSAKLTFTLPNKDNEQKMTPDQYPGSDNGWNSSYSEKHHFGYRWYDQNSAKPAFEFGFGLSYSKFDYSNIKINQKEHTVSFQVKNIGKVTAAEVAQLYFHVPLTKNYNGGYRSPKVLKNFAKVMLKPGEEQTVTIPVFDWDFSYWSNID